MVETQGRQTKRLLKKTNQDMESDEKCREKSKKKKKEEEMLEHQMKFVSIVVMIKVFIQE